MKKFSAVISISILIVIVVTIGTGPWLLDIIGNTNLFLGKTLIKIGDFLNFFGIGG